MTSSSPGAPAAPPPTLAVSGGIVPKQGLQPLLFAWLSPVTVTGDGFKPGETVQVSLFGPTNSLGVSPASLALGSATADASGHLGTTLTIPYDGGLSGPNVQIPRPGAYLVEASSQRAGTVSAKDTISLCPESDAKVIDWGHERGSRPGDLPGAFSDLSPERIDPHWISAWDERPVGAYGLVDESHFSTSDYPGSHYSHDLCFSLRPDKDYRWLIGTHNFADDGDVVEVEWETQNDGTPGTNGTGPIGLPLWAMPTDGDRVYVVGRWILDVGHPDGGSGTEIHPPRLLATMRQRPTRNASGNAASRVDIYLSGHGGGADRFSDGLSAALDRNGRGGGRIQDLGAQTAATYYQPGPATTAERLALAPLGFVMGLSPADLATYLLDTATLPSSAGPSAFGWLPGASEARPVDDMDYDFDVPLPPQPAGAVAPAFDVARHAEDTTAVNEVITWPDFPRSAHVHLPFLGKGSGVYARTIAFASAAPQSHYHVQLVEIDATDLPGLWRITADVSGQWLDLLKVNPALSQVAAGQTLGVGADFDVSVGSRDTLRIHVNGYRAQPIDSLFGQMFDMSCYAQLLTIAATAGLTGTRDNDDLGDAELELPQPLPTTPTVYQVASMLGTSPGHFQVVVLVEPK